MFIVYCVLSVSPVQFDVCLLLVYTYTVLSMNSTNKIEYTEWSKKAIPRF